MLSSCWPKFPFPYSTVLSIHFSMNVTNQSSETHSKSNVSPQKRELLGTQAQEGWTRFPGLMATRPPTDGTCHGCPYSPSSKYPILWHLHFRHMPTFCKMDRENNDELPVWSQILFRVILTPKFGRKKNWLPVRLYGIPWNRNNQAPIFFWFKPCSYWVRWKLRNSPFWLVKVKWLSKDSKLIVLFGEKPSFGSIFYVFFVVWYPEIIQVIRPF